MNRIARIGSFGLALAGLACIPSFAIAGDDAETRPLEGRQLAQAAAAPAAAPGVTGQGALKFKLFKGRDILPPKAIEVIKSAHGGFAVDRREGKGEIYFALPGAGIIRIAPDLQTSTLLDSPPELVGTNMHNTTLYTGPDGTPYLVFPANDQAKVLVTTLEGKLAFTLNAPTEQTEFGAPAVRDYFAKGGKFVPTDTAQLGNLLYVATGYSALDYVLAAEVDASKGFKAEWHELAFGGKGKGPGQFGTGHGITREPNQRHLAVADRPFSEIDHFTRHGHYLSTLKLPEGSLPCDIDYEGDLTVVGCLDGPDKTKGAPIYILKGDELVSTLMPKEDLGLDQFAHVHNAVIHSVGGKVYVIAQAWNPGDFAILEIVKE